MTNEETTSRPIAEALDSAELLELYALTPDDLKRIADVGERFGDVSSQIVDEFYGWLPAAGPWYDELFNDPSLLTHVKGRQTEYWRQFFTAQVDDDYIWQRRVVGQVHARIGLPLTAYFAGVSMFQRSIGELMRGDDQLDGDDAMALESIAKLVSLDMSIVVDTYSSIIEETLSEQANSMLAMSTPVTEIWDGVLFLPIVGLIDSHRAREIMRNTLAKIAESQAQVFILDISGVGVVDTAVANNMIRITKATKLMGCESIISGVSPAIAQTIVDLGIDVGRVRTTATMRDALAVSFQRMGREIAEVR